MAFKTMSILKNAMGSLECRLSSVRQIHVALPVPFDRLIGTRFVSPESGRGIEVGSMELMAVPKKKVSRYKRGLRNGPKALKPIPVIIRCKSCGRVKLPHFYCCSGDRGTSERNGEA
eukprot:TRINITY_DN27082_c0_g1_i1.p1 TRINITY_DN27082_c0_g1~~TRINITY_DN27082_c0_g1_i1.p1  ORF type:complete len:117 (+),score=7.13 TRINITY_DN27082_c0_g1_i1:159-509(+)